MLYIVQLRLNCTVSSYEKNCRLRLTICLGENVEADLRAVMPISIVDQKA